MYFDYRDSLLICTIDKVSSTTILTHFKKLAMVRDVGFNTYQTSRDETRDSYYGLRKGKKKSFFLPASV
jgi:hypothetical protein